MDNRLVLSDVGAKKIIEEKYSEKTDSAKEETDKAIEELRKKITHYKSIDAIQVGLEAEQKATSEYNRLFENVKDADDLKTAIYTALLDIRGQVEISDSSCKAIDDIISGLSREQEESMVQWYKEKVKKELIGIKTEKMKKEYALFRFMSDEEVEEYIRKYKKAYYAGSLLKARRASIRYTAHVLGADLPKCIQYDDPVEKETGKIVKREKQNIKDFSIKKRIKEDLSGVYEAIEEHAPDLARAIIGSNVFGIIMAMIAKGDTTTLPQTLGIYTAFGSMVFAICSAVICSKEIVQYMYDRSIIDEAKKTGLLDLSLEYSRACSDLASFEKSIKDSAKISGTGRIM